MDKCIYSFVKYKKKFFVRYYYNHLALSPSHPDYHLFNQIQNYFNNLLVKKEIKFLLPVNESYGYRTLFFSLLAVKTGLVARLLAYTLLFFLLESFILINEKSNDKKSNDLFKQQDLGSITGSLVMSDNGQAVMNYLAIIQNLQTGDVIDSQYTGNSNIFNFTDLTTPVEHIDEQVKDYVLFQNYPNPFNPSTNIEFSIPRTENVNLSVYNSIVELIKVLVDQELQAGHYKATWLVTMIMEAMLLAEYIFTGCKPATK
ncbi:MAG: hypothetical protein A2V93_09130 [Ignavibacteria bacterium RBG_16_34_14]|nr:MAG: hypothetical protein A2V93_09130 [Ignavibacteria bacterium RBG_16_34_14]